MVLNGESYKISSGGIVLVGTKNVTRAHIIASSICHKIHEKITEVTKST